MKKVLLPSGQKGPAILCSNNYFIVITSGWLRAGLYWLVPSLVAMTVTVPGAPPVRVMPLRVKTPSLLFTSFKLNPFFRTKILQRLGVP